jgi:hypothetical protein
MVLSSQRLVLQLSLTRTTVPALYPWAQTDSGQAPHISLPSSSPFLLQGQGAWGRGQGQPVCCPVTSSLGRRCPSPWLALPPSHTPFRSKALRIIVWTMRGKERPKPILPTQGQWPAWTPLLASPLMPAHTGHVRTDCGRQGSATTWCIHGTSSFPSSLTSSNHPLDVTFVSRRPLDCHRQ